MGELQDLVDGLALRLGRPVAVEDRRYRVLAYSAHGEQPDRVRLASILTREAPADVADWLDAQGLPQATAPVRLPAAPELGMGPRVAVPVRGDGVLGFVWLIDEAVGPAELAAAEEAAAAAAGPLARLREAQRSDPALVRDVLGGEAAARQAAAAALRDRGVRGPVHVLVARGAELERARKAVALPRHRVVIGGDLALVTGGDEVLRALAGGRPGGVVGVSAPRERVEQAHEALAEAETAAALGRPDEPGPADRPSSPIGGPFVRWERLGAYQLLAPLAGAPPPAPLRRLLDHPDAEPLVATLEAYLDSGGDARSAATALYVHRTSLYHRLRRIEAITQTSLRDGDDRLVLHIGVRIRRLRGLR
jgi:hypothetical protein